MLALVIRSVFAEVLPNASHRFFLVLNQLMWAKLSYCVSLSFSGTRCKHTNSCFAFLSTVVLKEFALVFASFCWVNSSVYVRIVLDDAVVV